MPLTSAPRKDSGSTIDNRKLLVERLASSSYLNKSARLHDMFLYLCERVLDHSVEVAHLIGLVGRRPNSGGEDGSAGAGRRAEPQRRQRGHVDVQERWSA